jgi:hypothetical protein
MILAESSPPTKLAEGEVTGVPGLPEDVFLIIIQYLTPTQIVLCRRVSKSWQKAFSSPIALRLAIKGFFPFAKEVQNFDVLAQVDGIAAKSIFDRVAGRYHNLLMGRPWTIEKHRMRIDPTKKYAQYHYPVAPWERHTLDISQDDPPFRFPPSLWTYEGNHVIYQDDVTGKLMLRNLDLCAGYVVPFKLDGKIIRNIRLRRSILVVEWAEATGSHRLNEEEVVHRHYATFFSVLTRSVTPENKLVPKKKFVRSETQITFRNELKIHFFGLPLNRRDRFYSNHDKKHYAVYFWQPNRSMYTGDEEAPIESLAVWDISDPCKYLPSADPAGHTKPASGGPQHILGLGFRELGYYGVRQRDVPAFTGIELDEGHVYIIETRNVWVRNLDTLLPRYQSENSFLWGARAVGIPLYGLGPYSMSHCTFLPRSRSNFHEVRPLLM